MYYYPNLLIGICAFLTTTVVTVETVQPTVQTH